MLRREEPHNPGQEATTSLRAFSIKLSHAFIESAHLFRVRFSPEMRLDRATVVSISEFHRLVLLREFDLA
jgi:hypothetical protein